MFAVMQDEALGRFDIAHDAMGISLNEVLAMKAPLSAGGIC